MGRVQGWWIQATVHSTPTHQCTEHTVLVLVVLVDRV